MICFLANVRHLERSLRFFFSRRKKEATRNSAPMKEIRRERRRIWCQSGEDPAEKVLERCVTVYVQYIGRRKVRVLKSFSGWRREMVVLLHLPLALSHSRCSRQCQYPFNELRERNSKTEQTAKRRGPFSGYHSYMYLLLSWR